MVVQLFVTVALMSSLIGQSISICLLLRCPMEWVLRFEHPITVIQLSLNAFAGT